MKNNNIRLKARFAAETRFEVQAQSTRAFPRIGGERV